MFQLYQNSFFPHIQNYFPSRQITIRYNRRYQIDKQSMQAFLFKKSKIAFRNNNKLAILTTSLQSTQNSSYSFILTLAEYLNSIKNLHPQGYMPIFKKKLSNNGRINKKQLERQQDLFEPWCDYLFLLLSKGKITSNKDQVILFDKIDEDSFKIIEKLDDFQIKTYAFSLEKGQSFLQIVDLVKGIQQQTVQKKKKIGIINFSTSILNHDKLKPKIHIQGLFSGIFYNPGEQWKAYRILKNDIPKLEDLLTFDTIVLSGSSYSVNNMAPQMKQFKQILLQALAINKSLKVLGLCFGHQFLAHSHNVQVVTKILNKGLLNINFSFEDSFQADYLNQFHKSELRFLRLFKYHADHVKSAPHLSLKVAQSQKCDVQAIISKDKRILSLQSHPEYTEEYIQTYESRLSTYQKCQTPQLIIQKDDFHHKSIEIIRKTIRNFISFSLQN